jgi:Na+-driven multidrug efflux pump
VNRHCDGSNYRAIFGVAIPVSVEAVFQASFSFIDQIVVGILGTVAVAAVGLSNNISFILTLLYAAIGTGSGAFIAQAYGRRDMDEVSKIAALGQIAAASLGACTALPLILFPVPILRLVGAQEEVIESGAGYLQLFAASAPVTVMSAVTTAAFRSMGDSRTPMAITIGTVVLNTLLALVLVLGLGSLSKNRGDGSRNRYPDFASDPLCCALDRALLMERGSKMALVSHRHRQTNRSSPVRDNLPDRAQ